MFNRNFQNEVKKHEGTTIRNHLRASRLWSAKYKEKYEEAVLQFLEQ